MTRLARGLDLARTLCAAFRWEKCDPCDVLLVCNDTDRSYVHQGVRYSPILDTLGDVYRARGLAVKSIANRYSSGLGPAAHGAPASISRGLLAARLLSLAAGPRQNLILDRRSQLETRLWRRVLNALSPQLILAIQPDPALCRAAHESGTSIFDVQHGIIETATGNSYYRRDTTHTKWEIDYPSGVLCWDKCTMDELERAGLGAPRRNLLLGHPWLTRFRHPAPDDALVLGETARLGDQPWGRIPILVTLQFGQEQFAADYVSNGVLAEAILAVIREDDGAFQWHLRLHPSQVAGADGGHARDVLRAELGHCDHVEWEAASRVALPVVLEQARAHLTHYSAVAKEGRP